MKSKKYSRKKNYCASSGSGTRRRFRGGMLGMFGTTPPPPPAEEARKKRLAERSEKRKAERGALEKNGAKIEEAIERKAEKIGKKPIYESKSKDRSINSVLKRMETGDDRFSEIKMSEKEKHYKKLAKQEREKEEKELDKELTGLEKEREKKYEVKKSKMEFLEQLKPADADKAKITNFPEAINRSIKLKNVKIPSGKKTRTFENGTSVETNDKRLRRLLSQITEFTEPGDDITLENVDLDYEGTLKMLELKNKHGNKAFEYALQASSLFMAGIITNEFLPLLTPPMTGPLLQVAKSELTGIMGLFRFNMGLVLQVIETMYESQNRIRRLQNKSSYERFNVDASKREEAIEKNAKEQSKKGQEDTERLRTLIDEDYDKDYDKFKDRVGTRVQGAAQGAAQAAARGMKALSRKGGGGTQLPYDQFADTGYSAGTSFFSFEGDVSDLDNTFTPTAEQSSFFKSIDYHDKI